MVVGVGVLAPIAAAAVLWSALGARSGKWR